MMDKDFDRPPRPLISDGAVAMICGTAAFLIAAKFVAQVCVQHPDSIGLVVCGFVLIVALIRT
jgi:hypothetical protein